MHHHISKPILSPHFFLKQCWVLSRREEKMHKWNWTITNAHHMLLCYPGSAWSAKSAITQLWSILWRNSRSNTMAVGYAVIVLWFVVAQSLNAYNVFCELCIPGVRSAVTFFLGQGCFYNFYSAGGYPQRGASLIYSLHLHKYLNHPIRFNNSSSNIIPFRRSKDITQHDTMLCEMSHNKSMLSIQEAVEWSQDTPGGRMMDETIATKPIYGHLSEGAGWARQVTKYHWMYGDHEWWPSEGSHLQDRRSIRVPFLHNASFRLLIEHGIAPVLPSYFLHQNGITIFAPVLNTSKPLLIHTIKQWLTCSLDIT